MADVPHLMWPFRKPRGVRGALAAVEQDGIDDVRQNVHAYIATERGERPLSPDFGVEDPTFAAAVDGPVLAREIMDAEPRADVEVVVVGPDGTGRASVDVVVGLVD